MFAVPHHTVSPTTGGDTSEDDDQGKVEVVEADQAAQ